MCKKFIFIDPLDFINSKPAVRLGLHNIYPHFMDNIFRNPLQNSEVDVIHLDFAKAFDKIDHEILFAKLKRLACERQTTEMNQKFSPKHRLQTVLINQKRPFLAKVMLSGVPQGSAVEP